MQVLPVVLCGCLLGVFFLCFYYLLREKPDSEADVPDDLGYLEKIVPLTDFEK